MELVFNNLLHIVNVIQGITVMIVLHQIARIINLGQFVSMRVPYFIVIITEKQSNSRVTMDVTILWTNVIVRTLVQGKDFVLTNNVFVILEDLGVIVQRVLELL